MCLAVAVQAGGRPRKTVLLSGPDYDSDCVRIEKFLVAASCFVARHQSEHCGALRQLGLQELPQLQCAQHQWKLTWSQWEPPAGPAHTDTDLTKNVSLGMTILSTVICRIVHKYWHGPSLFCVFG